MKKIKVGVASFTDPRITSMTNEMGLFNQRYHHQLTEHLTMQGHEVYDANSIFPKDEKRIFGIFNSIDALNAARYLKEKDIDCLILGCWFWTDSILPVQVSKYVDVPVLLYSANDDNYPGAGPTCHTAAGASLWEVMPHRHMKD